MSEMNFKKTARDAIKAGVDKLTDAVKVTLGPTGRVVMIAREYGNPYVTKDGVTVAKEVNLDDKFEQMGAQMVKQVAIKAASEVGDGTTTATIMTQAIYEAGLMSVDAGAKPLGLKRGIDKAVNVVSEYLGSVAKPIVSDEQLLSVAKCSANHDDQIGTVVADALKKVGRNGVVTIEEGRSIDTFVSVVDGYQFDRGYISPYFVTDTDKMLCEHEMPRIMLCDYKLSNFKSLFPILEKCIKNKISSLVIVAEDVDAEVLNGLVVNHLRKIINVVVIRAPWFGERRTEILSDIATLTGGTVISKELGPLLEKADLSHLGTCEKIKIDRDTTTIYGGCTTKTKAAVDKLIAQVTHKLEVTVRDFDREKLQDRLAKLTGGVAQIIVGGMTETEVREKRDRVDDALHACKAAIAEGILPGGGVAMLRSQKVLNKLIKQTKDRSEQRGIEIVIKALEAPIRQIAINTDVDPGSVITNILRKANFNYGYDAAADRYGDMFKFGILVPTKVERVALQNAASIAGLLLTTDCMIAKENIEAPISAGMPQMPQLQ